MPIMRTIYPAGKTVCDPLLVCDVLLLIESFAIIALSAQIRAVSAFVRLLCVNHSQSSVAFLAVFIATAIVVLGSMGILHGF